MFLIIKCFLFLKGIFDVLKNTFTSVLNVEDTKLVSLFPHIIYHRLPPVGQNLHNKNQILPKELVKLTYA